LFICPARSVTLLFKPWLFGHVSPRGAEYGCKGNACNLTLFQVVSLQQLTVNMRAASENRILNCIGIHQQVKALSPLSAQKSHFFADNRSGSKYLIKIGGTDATESDGSAFWLDVFGHFLDSHEIL
jgi:hypothetical protein